MAAQQHEDSSANSERRSRYRVINTNPPNLTNILRLIQTDAAVRRSGAVPDKTYGRGIICRAHRCYKNDSGKADDAWRFLLKFAVLIEMDDGFWFDGDRGQHILTCCERACEPNPPRPPQERVEAIKASRIKMSPTFPPDPPPSQTQPVRALTLVPPPPVLSSVDQEEGPFVFHSRESLAELDDGGLVQVSAQLDEFEREIAAQRALLADELRTRERLAERLRLEQELKQVEIDRTAIAEEEQRLRGVQEELRQRKQAAAAKAASLGEARRKLL